MTSPSAVVCREVFDENSQPSAEGNNFIISAASFNIKSQKNND